MKNALPDNARGSHVFALCVSVLAAFVALMICSMNSFLYSANPWVDVNCFVTVTRGWMNGLLPYRDLAEQKGPLLYLIHMPALLAFPRSYHGLFFLELVEVTAALFIMWKIARLYAPRLSALWLIPLAALLCATFGFQMGDSAEETCWPLVLASMYAALRAWRTGRPISMKGYLLHGFLAGCVLWIKFNQLGPHFVFMAMLAILAVWEDRSVARALRMCGMFLLGMLLATVPWLVYFAARGALGDFLGMYLIDNIFGYTTSNRTDLNFTAYYTARAFWQNKPLTLALAVAALRVLTLRRARMGRREKAYLALTAIVLLLAVYGGGRFWNYYILAFAPLCALALPALEGVEALIRRGLSKLSGALARRAAAAGLALVLLLGSAGFAWKVCDNVPMIGVPFGETPIGRLSAIVTAEEDRTLVNFGVLDLGLYFAADVQPVTRYFCALNNYGARAARDQTALLMDKRVNFVVTRDYTLEDYATYFRENDDILEDDFDPDYRQVAHEGDYYLFQRNGTREE